MISKLEVRKQQTRKKQNHERIDTSDQRSNLRNDRGRGNRPPRRTRWKDILLLLRTLSAKVSVHAHRGAPRENVRRLLWVESTRTHRTTAARNEFANLSFAGTEKTNQPKKYTVMKMKSTVIGGIIAVTQSKWMRPALMTLALLAALVGLTGCPHPH